MKKWNSKKVGLISFLIIFFEINNINSESLKFSVNLIYNHNKPGFYIRQAVSDQYVYVVSAEDAPENQKTTRYVTMFNRKTGSYDRSFSYQSNILIGGEVTYLLTDSHYLLITNINGDDEILDYVTQKTKHSNAPKYGYRRAFITVGNYYYEEFIESTGCEKVTLCKMQKEYYSDGIPGFVSKNYNTQITQKKWGAMVSCDITLDKQYILCAFYSSDLSVSVAVYNSDLVFMKEQKYQKPYDYTLDNFIKIVYLNENSNFVIINSQDNNISRLRLIRYTYNYITDKIAPIIHKQTGYIDTEYSIKDLHNAEIDITVADSDKVIMLYVNKNEKNIYITIFQFYSSNTELNIKVYIMENNNGFSNFCQGRINMIKNSYFITLAPKKNDIHRPAYTIINYPNSKDITLTNGNTIIIKDIIWLENAFLNLNLKFKILKIEKDFIFINSKSKEVKKNEELDLSDKLILRQYRLSGKNSLYFEPIARGSDYGNGYYYMKNYGTLRKNELYFGGREGKIYTNFNDCLNGYYHFEYDMNLCSNVKPDNYYIDEKNRIYKACQSPCEKCSGPKISDTSMNCITCKSNYYITEDTKSCYNKVIDNYYLDNDNILKRCHSNCLQCSYAPISDKFMNCIKCQKNYYITEDTNSCYNTIIDNYYLDKDNILKRCHSKCLQCNNAPINDTYMNCIKCQNNYHR